MIFVHVAFQPLVSNAWASQWATSPDGEGTKLAYALSLVVAVFWMLRSVTLSEECDADTHMNCSNKGFHLEEGKVHLSYFFKMRRSGFRSPSSFAWAMLFFGPSLFVKKKKGVFPGSVFLCLFLPFLSSYLAWYFLSPNDFCKHEGASTWCIVVFTTWILQLALLQKASLEYV